MAIPPLSFTTGGVTIRCGSLATRIVTVSRDFQFFASIPAPLKNFLPPLVLQRTTINTVRPFIMRIRFRASEFGVVAKIKLSRAKIQTGFLCGDHARVNFFLLV